MVPDNFKKRWIDIDIQYIFTELKNNSSINDISLVLKRTPSSVKNKLLSIANQLINIYGLDIDLISILIKIDKDEINNHFNLYYKTDELLNFKKDYDILCNEISESKIKKKNKEKNINDIIPQNNHNTIEITLNNEQQQALDEFIQKKNIFLTGPAGTGKSVTLKKIIEYCKENKINYGITATTGTASLLIGGKTINSYLGIGLGDKNPTNMFETIRYKYPHIMKRIRELNVLIIDEISMMDAELFNNISNYLKLARRNNLPFGGIQVVITGDFCQLESVHGDYCFNATEWKELNLQIIFLYKMIRQNEDKQFQKMLKELRYGICSEKTYNKLLECKDTIFNDIKPTILYPKNIDVDKINSKEYNKLLEEGKEEKTYSIIYPELKKYWDKTKNWIKTLDIPNDINLCIGTQIVVTANINQDKGLVNGTRGKIIELFPDKIIIQKIDNTFDTITYHKCILEEDNTIHFSYMPIKLAYALTIHKAQGMTIDSIEIDIGNNIFASGQAYTALSRARSLKSIKIKALSKKSFIIKNEVLEFYSKIDNKLIID